MDHLIQIIINSIVLLYNQI